MNITKPLNEREAQRLQTVIEQKKGIRLTVRELRSFSPQEIAKQFKQHRFNAGEIARMAGRKDVSQRSPA